MERLKGLAKDFMHIVKDYSPAARLLMKGAEALAAVIKQNQSTQSSQSTYIKVDASQESCRKTGLRAINVGGEQKFIRCGVWGDPVSYRQRVPCSMFDRICKN
jgi:hypothetical protein